jgi:hypothetical protein
VVEALTRMEESERRRLGDAARRRILARHTGTERARHLAALLDELPGRGAGDSADEPPSDIIKQGAVG